MSACSGVTSVIQLLARNRLSLEILENYTLRALRPPSWGQTYCPTESGPVVITCRPWAIRKHSRPSNLLCSGDEEPGGRGLGTCPLSSLPAAELVLQTGQPGGEGLHSKAQGGGVGCMGSCVFCSGHGVWLQASRKLFGNSQAFVCLGFYRLVFALVSLQL